MAIQTKQVISGKIATLLADNNTQEISESDVREVVVDLLDTLVALVTINKLGFGDQLTGTNKSIVVDTGEANLPELRYNGTTLKWQFSNNGTIFQDFGSGGISGLEEDQILFGNAAGEIAQDSLFEWIASATKLVLGADTEFDATAALKILHTSTDYVKIEGKNATEQGRVGLRSTDGSNQAELGVYPEAGVGNEAHLIVQNILQASDKITVRFETALVEVKGEGTLDDAIISVLDSTGNELASINNRGELKGAVSLNPPVASDADTASIYVANSRIGGSSTDGNASWFLRTEDGSVVDLRQADIDILTQNVSFPFEDSATFPFKGNSNVFDIVGVVFSSTQIASVNYFVRRPAVGVPSGMNFQAANDLLDVQLWINGSNTIGGVAYTSPSNFDEIEIMPQVTFASGWESTAGFTFVIKRKSL